MVHEALRVDQPADVAAHQIGEPGVDLADARDQPQTDLVAQVLRRAVRRILAVGYAVRDGVFQDLLARGEVQRADQMARPGVDAGQAAQPRAPQQVDEKGFDRVVGVVRHGDDVVALPAAQLVEPGVAQPPGGHLHGFARALHLADRVEPPVVARHAEALRLAGHHRLVLLALLAPQLEIAVGDAHAVAALEKEREHHHRVHASRYGQQNALVVRDQLVLLDIALKVVCQHLAIRY